MFSTDLAEIVLIVNDVKAAAQFYRDVVGLTPEIEADDAWAWFWAGAPGQARRVALHKGTLLFEEHSPLPEGKRWGQVH
ncbi:MAG TPA: VOC family protein, partial [Roseiflexaceae bacterium]